MSSPIPAVLAAISVYHLSSTGLLSTLTAEYFNLGISEQIALLLLLFALVFFAVSVATFVGPPNPSPGTSHDVSPPPAFPSLRSADDDKSKFLLLFPYLRNILIEHVTTKHELPAVSQEWVSKMVDYNVQGGKLNRGLTVLAVHRTLITHMQNRSLTENEVALASVLGWAIEFLQAFFLVADDVMDDSQTRRGQPCWYKQPHVKNIAINDSFILESFVFTLIKKHFGGEKYYTRLVDLFLEVTQQTEMGQLLDLTTQPLDKPIDLNNFTLERYQLIVKYKTAFYSFYLPVATGMITSGIDDESAYVLAKEICCLMGEYFQIQDDYLDCFGDPKTIGKIGTDIQDNKCSWLVVQALKRSTPAQRKILEDNYGKWDDDKVAKVKALYKEMELPKVFEAYEEKSYELIQAKLEKVTSVPRDVFVLFLKKIYKRNK